MNDRARLTKLEQVMQPVDNHPWAWGIMDYGDDGHEYGETGWLDTIDLNQRVDYLKQRSALLLAEQKKQLRPETTAAVELVDRMYTTQSKTAQESQPLALDDAIVQRRMEREMLLHGPESAFVVRRGAAQQSAARVERAGRGGHRRSFAPRTRRTHACGGATHAHSGCRHVSPKNCE